MDKEQETIKKIQKAVGKKENYSLEDVMITLRKYGKGILFGGANNSFYQKSDDKVKWLGICWKSNTPFHEQSDETKSFIGNLLK